MAARWSSWLSRPGLLWALTRQVRLAFRLIREPRVRFAAKILPLAAVAYVLFPVDFLPDLIPVLGQIDDLALLLAAMEIFIRLAPEAVAAFHRAAIAGSRRYGPMPAAGTVIDAEWRRE